jgi:undecaprenyl-diphosphatase
LHAAATAVAYSRIHTGVHYPADAIAGSVIGTSVAAVVCRILDRS